jgi:hypothetical protein
MTPAERKTMLRRELDRALDEAAIAAIEFRERSAEVPPAPNRRMLRKIARAASELYLKVGLVSGFAALLEREGKA